MIFYDDLPEDERAEMDEWLDSLPVVSEEEAFAKSAALAEHMEREGIPFVRLANSTEELKTLGDFDLSDGEMPVGFNELFEGIL